MFHHETFPSSLFNVPLAKPLALDPDYRPLALGVKNYRKALAAHGSHETVVVGLEQNSGSVARLELEVFPKAAGRDVDNLRYVSWMVNGLLWVCGGWRVSVGGPKALCEAIAAEYSVDGPWKFEREIMGQAFNRPFEVVVKDPADIAPAGKGALTLGGNLKGCRIGFDLGASDYKVAAVVDGEVVFSTEIPWTPKTEADPAYHYKCIHEGFKLAASHMPRLDAIGGSSAGILVDNQVMVASLFRAVPKERFLQDVSPIFLKLRDEWKVPLEVINDGDVTALAGGLSLEQNGILGIALGSSEAVGFLDRNGKITGWLNELAFSTVDANPTAGTDDWSGNPGVGAAYFSQQAVDKLAGPAGLSFPADMGLPERLKEVQALMAKGEPAARAIFETIGAYLGYTLPWYAEFYDLEHAMILGRVTSGEGGEIILAKAKEVLAAEFPEVAKAISIFLPDEKSRRVGQAVAAASLPALA
ncbi:MAG: ROK family protein [Acidobacteria bacterium]|nr:ROK family protein [Acidobacteriota bacterium]MBI3490099.1 ROK family protein [Acidobacteriota bacterium]